jgi:YbgC/YbaW family acyl-CoA thioester hydrolase
MKKEDFKFSVDVPVRFSDMDALGHVNNAAYISYFEEGRVHYLHNLLDLPRDDTSALGIIVLDMHCNYRSPAYYGEVLRVHTKVTWLKNKSLEMTYLITDIADGRKVADGSSVLVAYDYSARKTTEIPTEFREKISSFEGISPMKG